MLFPAALTNVAALGGGAVVVPTTNSLAKWSGGFPVGANLGSTSKWSGGFPMRSINNG